MQVGVAQTHDKLALIPLHEEIDPVAIFLSERPIPHWRRSCSERLSEASARDAGADYTEADGHKRKAAVASPGIFPTCYFGDRAHHSDNYEHDPKSKRH